jgi:hypothetical protein
MDIRIELAVITLGLLIWGLIGIAVRKARLYPSYAVLWGVLGSLLVLLPFYAQLLRWAASNVFGILGANHLIYGILFGFLLIYLFYLNPENLSDDQSRGTPHCGARYPRKPAQSRSFDR